MTVAVAILGALAVVLAVALSVITLRWRGASQEAATSAEAASAATAKASEATADASEATARAASAKAAADTASARATDAETKAAEAERRADAAEARAAAAAAAAGEAAASENPVIDAVWELQQLRVTLAHRDLARISTAAPESSGPARLADAVGEEVARIREEIGTPGELQAELTEEPPPAIALLLLRATETLLPILTRRSDAYDVLLAAGDKQVEVGVVCEGADPESFPDADTDAVANAIARAGGTLSFDRTEDGRVRAWLRCQTGS